jgi:hypothetical protein
LLTKYRGARRHEDARDDRESCYFGLANVRTRAQCATFAELAQRYRDAVLKEARPFSREDGSSVLSMYRR